MINPTCEECGGACCKIMLLRAPANLNLADDGVVWLREHDAAAGEVMGIKSYIIHHPCRRLEEGLCTIYPNRPATCVELEVDGPLCFVARMLASTTP